WNSGLTTQLQGGALCRASDLLRQDLLKRASAALKVDAANLTIRDGVISSKDKPATKITFAQLVKANGGQIRSEAACVHPGSIGSARNRGVGCCLAEVEVGHYTGHRRVLRAAEDHESRHTLHPPPGGRHLQRT